MATYKTFKRSANNFAEFATAAKITVSTGLPYDDARQECQDFNDNRTQKEIESGTKMEFTKED